MTSATVGFDTSKFFDRLDRIERQHLPKIIASALTQSAFGARKDVQEEMARVFDRPTPYAIRGVTYEAARPNGQPASVQFYGSSSGGGGLPPAYFMRPSVHGGMRSLKAFEKQLIERGFMQSGEVAVPARRQALDRYGNVSQGQLNRILSALQVDYRGAGATRLASTAKGKAKQASRGMVFVPQRGSKLAPGIWFSSGKAKGLWPLFLFVRPRAYTSRLAFHAIVARHHDQHFESYFHKVWSRIVK